MEERHKIRIGVDLFLEKEGKVLLMLRQNTGYADGMYDLPGGHLEPNEDIFDAMVREAKEEIGIDIDKQDLQIIHIYHRFSKDMLKFVFKADKYQGELTNGEPDLCAELKWFDRNELPENIVKNIKNEIISINNNEYFSSSCNS